MNKTATAVFLDCLIDVQQGQQDLLRGGDMSGSSSSRMLSFMILNEFFPATVCLWVRR